MVDPELDKLYHNLVKAKSPEDIFGELLETDRGKLLNKATKVYRFLIKLAHPDKYQSSKEDKYIAEESTKILNDMYQKAHDKVKSGTYGAKDHFTCEEEIVSEMDIEDVKYKIFKQSFEGDFTQILVARRTNQINQVEKVVLKVAQDSADNDLLKNESEILQKIQHKHLPVFIDHFMIDDRAVNVLRFVEHGLDLISLKEQFPDGLPAKHMVWILDRLLSIVGYLHLRNCIHGSIEPANIIIIPHEHDAVLLDFVFGITDANQKGKKYQGTNDFSAPEISKKKSKVHPASDLYSLGKTMLYLVGGNVDQLVFPKHFNCRIERYLAGFMVDDPKQRANDAWELWHQLKRLRKEEFGAPSQFLPLDVKI